jgi:hypothetical protein
MNFCRFIATTKPDCNGRAGQPAKVTGYKELGVNAPSGQKHLKLLKGCVLAFDHNNKSVTQRLPRIKAKRAISITPSSM